MSIYASIENRERGLLCVLNDGLPGSRVIVIRQRTEVELIPGPQPVDNVARIKGVNGLYINIVGPVGGELLVWSQEPREWKHNIDDNTLSTTYQGETLYWFLHVADDSIILNPYKGSPFLYVPKE